MKRYVIIPTTTVLILLTAFGYLSLYKADDLRSPLDRPRPGQKLSFTLITGSNSPFFFPGLKNLVGSVHKWSPDRDIVVWDLGLSPEQVAEVKTWCRVTYRKFDFDKYPPHLRNLHTYAWKPVIVKEMVDTYERVLWIDAGSHINDSMSTMDQLMWEDGYILIQGQDADTTLFLHEKMCLHLGLKKTSFKNKPSFAGGFNGWSNRPYLYQKLLIPWFTCALTQRCIAPEGASLANHRFDQSALTVISYSSGLDLKPHTELNRIEKESRNGNKMYLDRVRKKPC
ncbi:uncharacterized protein LOC106160006 [Lingula anatina]|uniref:Uncharacterized protein LOC106160006 n=1 Tax=Lingula anatina TaxID=7574 RepID=A0A1S3I294_LINAN|nr:uncharacterized protein LOC106160006 [Lingula anatina]|eukprot:XP_013391951.1 uncharacterized protein LOC106160006 [Lingula anatina]